MGSVISNRPQLKTLNGTIHVTKIKDGITHFAKKVTQIESDRL